ncbi:hypothetical protein LMANV2_180031 [Leptospira interrogans serovar Manilae]|uniref:Uncharacterized protein n=1 Tax=Leptospira interrogans serovar Manilae TaxID=214675 RepID=A0AAQ1SMN5_LEPIR|nr:hypothetical protein LMANV2_180031 [Leptospira interrogans serovar Manilae]
MIIIDPYQIRVLHKILDIRIVEKLILYGFSLYGNGRLKRFVNCCYGIFQQFYSIL